MAGKEEEIYVYKRERYNYLTIIVDGRIKEEIVSPDLGYIARMATTFFSGSIPSNKVPALFEREKYQPLTERDYATVLAKLNLPRLDRIDLY